MTGVAFISVIFVNVKSCVTIRGSWLIRTYLFERADDGVKPLYLSWSQYRKRILE